MSTDYDRIAQAIHYLEEHFRNQPSLDDLAAHLNLSPFHLQRLFKEWAGISPKKFIQYLTTEYAKELLANSVSVLDAAYEAGLSGPGRLHDLFVTVEAVTPGEFKQQGKGIRIDYGIHATPFGDALIATTARGLCALSFLNGGGSTAAIDDLHARWRAAELTENPSITSTLVEQIFPQQDAAASRDNTHRPLNLHVQGTNFQVKVWEALLKIPAGSVSSYDQIAHRIGQPTAARAVGGAISANPVAYLIPCHRVIRKSGAVNDYRWGATRKKAMIGWEAAHLATG